MATQRGALARVPASIVPARAVATIRREEGTVPLAAMAGRLHMLEEQDVLILPTSISARQQRRQKNRR